MTSSSKPFFRFIGADVGKTDAIDARALAQYGRERADKLRLWLNIEKAGQRLQSLVLTRNDLVKERTAFKNRSKAPGAAYVKTHLQSVIDCLIKQIGCIETEIKELIRSQPTLARNTQIMRTIEGVGGITATGLLALMPELGTLDRRQAAGLAGVAPHPNQSGNRDGYRRTKGGRIEVRNILFMAALTASRSKKPLGIFYQKLIANGKRKWSPWSHSCAKSSSSPMQNSATQINHN